MGDARAEPVTLEAMFAVVGVIATVIGVAVLAARLPPAERPPPAPGPRPGRGPRPSQLLRIERIVERSAESATAAHTLLRPLLVEIAEARLARRGVQLSREPHEAQLLLGPEAWSSCVPTARSRLTSVRRASPQASLRRCSRAWRPCERDPRRRGRGSHRPDPGRG